MKVRLEYEVAQALMWDAGIRREFLSDPRAALARHFPTLTAPERFGPWQFAGIEEEAYRRSAELCRVSREVFPRGYHLLAACGGEAFFELVLRGYLRPGDSPTEPFDFVHVGTRVLEAAAEPALADVLAYTLPVLKYEWARFRARQAIQEQVDPRSSPGALVAGADLVYAPFDLSGLLQEIDRIARAQAPSWLFLARARPTTGRFRRVIFPQGRQIIEADVDEHLFETLSRGLAEPGIDISRFGAAYPALRSAGLLKESIS